MIRLLFFAYGECSSPERRIGYQKVALYAIHSDSKAVSPSAHPGKFIRSEENWQMPWRLTLGPEVGVLAVEFVILER